MPAPQNELLQKKEFVADVPYMVQLLMGYEQMRKGRRYEKFDSKTDIALPEGKE